MARNGYPDDPNNYSEGDPTQYAGYGGTGGQAYSEYDQPPTGYHQPPASSGYGQPPTGYHQPPTGYGQYPVQPRPAWHHRPAVLVGLGVLTAALLALLFYAIVSFTNAGSSKSPGVTSSATTSAQPSTQQSNSGAPAPQPTQSAGPAPSRTEAPAPVTTTTTAAPTTTAPPTTSEAPPPTTTNAPTVTTVTETTTKHLWPTLPRPTLPPPTQPPAVLDPPTGG